MGNIKKRIIINTIFKSMVFIIAFLAILPLFLIIFYIARQGIRIVNWDFLISLPKPVGQAGGGIMHSLVGTLILISIAGVSSIPIGIATGIYLSEKRGKLASVVRQSIDLLQGIPSIVIGIIGYIWFVLPMKKFSALAGGLTLGIMMLPMIIKSTEETLNLIPYSLKEASLALGVPYYKTILRVILPAGLSGIVTGVLVGIARIAGETAPLLFTAFGNPYLNTNILKPIDSIPILIYNYSTSPFDEWIKIAWGASFVLIVIILILNLVVRLVCRKWKIQF